MRMTTLAIFQDWKRNSIKGRIVLTMLRIAHMATLHPLLLVIMVPYLIVYRVCVEWVLGIEIPYKLTIGKGLALHHGQSLVINDKTNIGKNCRIRHNTTIGNKQNKDGTYSGCPVLGNNVDMGANVCIIGEITIGDNVKIGAGTVVVKDIPANSIAVGNPARFFPASPPIEINHLLVTIA